MISDIVSYDKGEAPSEMRKKAIAYEERFGVVFETLTYYPKKALERLTLPFAGPEDLPENVLIASRQIPGISSDMAVLTRVANLPQQSDRDRADYLEAMLRIYRQLPIEPSIDAVQATTICVGVRREGEHLARRLDLLPPGHSVTPDLKRIWHEGGLIVGMSAVPPLRKYRRCMIIDGAIASGATAMTIMERLKAHCQEFHLYSAHGPFEGLRAIVRFAQERGLALRLCVGHATFGLNPKFYATNPEAPHQMMIGDVGDTICGTPPGGSH